MRHFGIDREEGISGGRMNATNPLSERFRIGLVRQFPGREAWALTDQAIVSATNFLTNVMLARFMGLREFGIFVLAWMSVLFVNSLQNALIVSPMMSIGPKQEEKDRPSYFGAVVFQEIVLVTFCFVLVFVALKTSSSIFRHADLQHLALPLAVSAIAYQMQDFLRRYFFATLQSRRALADDALSYPTQLPILFLLHRAGHLNSATALWVMAGTSILGLVAGWFWMERLEFHWDWIKEISRRHWRVSRWLTASAILQWTSGNLFVLAAPVYYGAAAAGVLKASQNLMGVTHVWFQGLDNVVPVETARRLRVGGVHAMLAYTRSILVKWGGLTLLFAAIMAVAPGFWLRLLYGPEMVQYGYVLRLYALLYVMVFLGGPLRAGLQALEFTVPIFWSYLAMTAFAFSFAVPMAKWLGLSGTMLGLIATQILFQGTVFAALMVKSSRLLQEASPAAPPAAAAEERSHS
jgi:O-antigen/teichoic acid export membrane protein